MNSVSLVQAKKLRPSVLVYLHNVTVSLEEPVEEKERCCMQGERLGEGLLNMRRG